MSEIVDRRERYMRDPVPVRLGGIAANLARISSVSKLPGSQAVVFGLLEESKHFIEWTAREAEMEIAGRLAECQVKFALWQRTALNNWADENVRRSVGEGAKVMSDEILQQSGLLNAR